MPSNRVRAVQQLRRSNAAGPHGSRPTRAAQMAEALADWNDEPTDNDINFATDHEETPK